MNDKNYEYLNKQLLNTGFGEGHADELKQKMEKGENDFALFHKQTFGKDEAVATMHFRKSAESDMYFFNQYTLIVKNEGKDETLQHRFYINNKEDSITLKQGYNLIQGRAVYKERTNKEEEKYNAWISLDFKNTDNNGNYRLNVYHENYGYDLKEVLGKYSIREMGDPALAKRLVESLERGNRQQVTMDIKGQEQKVFIEASPKFKSLNVYQASGQRMKAEELFARNGQEQKTAQGAATKVTAQKADQPSDEDEGGSEKKTSRRRQRQAQ